MLSRKPLKRYFRQLMKNKETVITMAPMGMLKKK